MARLVSTTLVKGLVTSCSPASAAGTTVVQSDILCKHAISTSQPLPTNPRVTAFRVLFAYCQQHQVVSQPAIQQCMNYSSGHGGASDSYGDSSTLRVAADPDTHQDFQPTSKSSGTSLRDIVAQDVKENTVMICMKGHPDAPRCGLSALAVKVLNQYGVRITSRDILTDLKLKESVKAHTSWPTFPQIFIKGEFIGGSDIILNMHQKGELKDLLDDIPQKGGQNNAT